MYNTNRVTLIGQLTADPQLSTTQSGKAKLVFRLATNYSWKNSDGEWQDGVDFHQVVAWRKTAERMKDHTKGERLYVEGKLHTHSWEDDAGERRYSTEIIASRVDVMGKLSSAKQDDSVDHGEEVIEVVEIEEGTETPVEGFGPEDTES